MKRFFLSALLAAAVHVDELYGESVQTMPPAQQILSFARAQLPAEPVRLTGTLTERAPNGFVKNRKAVVMELNWRAEPPQAVYGIGDMKSGEFQTLEIQWTASGPVFQCLETRADGSARSVAGFDPSAEIPGLGATWNDLSFSFLWSSGAETVDTGKKLGRDCYVVAVPRGANRLLLWIEQATGRLLGAREETAAGQAVKELKVVSVKEFDDLWMVKDVDMVRLPSGARTSLRIDRVDAGSPK
jgi:hypothetical protein